MSEFAPYTIDLVRCKDCGGTFEPFNVSTSRLDPNVPVAIVLAYAPKQCPHCRNLKAVESGPA